MQNIKIKSPFELLRSKSILSILNGDENFGRIDDVDISMPYLNGSTLVDISQLFGMPITYGRDDVIQSRWVYLDNLLVHCISNNKVNELLAYLFSKKQFEIKLKGKTPDEIEEIYRHIIEIILEQINGKLSFGGNNLVVRNKRFSITSSDSMIEIEAPTVSKLDREYIKDISDRAMQDVIEKNYDSAITKSRTLLEEVFCFLIEKKNEEPSAKGDIGKMYRRVKGLYNMHGDKDLDRRINTLLSGLEKIVSSIAEMRNANSDAHGVGSKRLIIDEHHARLLVNSAMTMAEFMSAVGNSD